MQTAELNLAQVEASIAASDTPSSATIAQDEAAVKQAEATVAADEKAVAATVLTAPIAGTVTAVNGAVGSTVSAGASTVSVAGQSSSSASSSSSSSPTGGGNATSSSSGFVTIDSLHQLVVVAGFAEADAADLSVGQPATLTFPALTNTEVAGKVVAVSNSSTVVNNVVTYDATIALVNPPADVKQGMTTDVSVATSTRSSVLVLPTAAITTNGTISTVQVLRDGETTVTQGDDRARRQLDDGDRERAPRRRRRRRADGERSPRARRARRPAPAAGSAAAAASPRRRIRAPGG